MNKYRIILVRRPPPRSRDSRIRSFNWQDIRKLNNGVTTRDLRMRVCLASRKFLLEAADDLPPGVHLEFKSVSHKRCLQRLKAAERRWTEAEPGLPHSAVILHLCPQQEYHDGEARARKGYSHD